MAGLRSGLRFAPAEVFGFLALVAGTYLAFTVPAFAGIDEGGHFARAYDLTQGDRVPEATADPALVSGVCIPGDVVGDIHRGQREALQHALDAAGVDELPGTDPDAPESEPAGADECEGDEELVGIATFAWYSPVGYAPQVVVVGAGRALGTSTETTLRLARLAVVVVYALLGWVAVRRTPIAPWALAVAGLVPVALFQAATSVSPDALTTAMALLVTSSALRLTARGSPPGRAGLAEAVGFSVVLGLCKPSYAVIALVYLLVLHRHRERASWWIAAAPAAGIAVSALWQRAHRHLFACDVTSFGVAPAPGEQLREVLGAPHRFTAGVGRAAFDSADGWLDGLIEIGDPRVLSLPTVVVVLVAVVLSLVVLLTPAGEGAARLVPLERLGIGALALVGFGAVMGGWFVYCNSVGFDLDVRPHARLFAPLLPLAAVSVAGLLAAPPGSARARRTAPVAATTLGIVVVAWAIGVAATMS